MKKTRVLVVEDSLTVRRRLCEILSADPAIELVGEAADGKRAIELCQDRRPDVVTMDMMLPVMSGLAATEYIMAHCPTPILVVSSSVHRGELFKTYEALAAGAVDVLEKPNGDEPAGAWERNFVAVVKLVSRIRVITHPRARLAALAQSWLGPAAIAAATAAPQRDCEIVAIGASTGGPGAIVEVLRGLPAAFDRPVLLASISMSPLAPRLRIGSMGRPAGGSPILKTAIALQRLPVASSLHRPTGISLCATGGCGSRSIPNVTSVARPSTSCSSRWRSNMARPRPRSC